jgi:hypothetical protein
MKISQVKKKVQEKVDKILKEEAAKISGQIEQVFAN